MLSALFAILRLGCGGRRAGGEALPYWRSAEQFDEFAEDFESRSEESDGSPPRQLVRRFACGAASGMLLALSFMPLIWLSFPLVSNSGFLRSASSTPENQARPVFREKVLVTQKPLAPSSTTRQMVLPPTIGPAITSTTDPLRPTEDLHDGNVCLQNEELYAGLCYRKCSLLTSGEDPIRTSPWTCCRSHPCALNQKGSLGSHVACTGYDVAGDGSCPHRPGACLKDEELFLGVCYKKCDLLTDQAFPNRVGPATCCKDSGLGCLDFRKDYTSEEFAVGGGEADRGACGAEGELPHKGHDGVWHLGCLDPRQDKTRSDFDTPVSKDSNNKAHLPLKNLTEATGSVSVVRA